MDRINTATKAVDLYGAGKHGFKNSNATLGTPPTDLNAEFFNGSQEELLAVIEGAGIAPAIATLTQVRQAIKRIAGANVRTITAVGPTALTADDAGLIVVDATANAVTITLPAANAVAGVSLEFQFVRSDITANAVTINRAGADTFLGGATALILSGRFDQRVIRSNSTNTWLTTSSGGSQSLVSNGYREVGGGLILQWCQSISTALPSNVVTNVTANWPIAFPNAYLAGQASIAALSTANISPLYGLSSTTTQATCQTISNGGSSLVVLFFGIGR